MLYLSKSIKNVFLYNYVNEYGNASYLAIVNEIVSQKMLENIVIIIQSLLKFQSSLFLRNFYK